MEDSRDAGTGRGHWITVGKAATNNLREVSVRIPKGALTVFTGVSGSGKSSLALDTVAAEAQRLVNDSYPAFVRNRLPHAHRPDVQTIDGLTFTVLIDQRRFAGNARSTVATATDIAPLLRLVFSRVGEPSAGHSPAYSFNDPSGMCPRCEGLGVVQDVDVDAMLDLDKSIDEGPVLFPVFRPGTYRWKRFAYSGLFDRAKPLRDYTAQEMHDFLYAEGMKPPDPDPRFPRTARFDGVVTRMRDAFIRRPPTSMSKETEQALHRVVTAQRCPRCRGRRLNEAALASLIDGRSIADWTALPVDRLHDVVAGLREPRVAPALAEARRRLEALRSVGLGYLSLDRVSSTLSGGEAQRVKIIRYLGSPLSSVTYVFDEPSSGLHPHDVRRLTELLLRLRAAANTVLVVEHHPQVVMLADHVVDLGPGAGEDGGRILYEGTPDGLLQTGGPTARALREPVTPRTAIRPDRGHVMIRDAREHNLRGIDVAVPLERLTAVTGVAGSGKSSLITGELPRQHPGFTVVGQEALRGGGRSTPLSQLGLAERVRQVFAAASGLAPAWFSFNSKGACPVCKGRGFITTDLAFLDDVATPCEECEGARFNPRALAVRVGGASIADVLAASPGALAELFAGHADIVARLGWMRRVGLGYLAVGQPLDTLSGGEKQRLLLARHLGDVGRGHGQRIVLDEPTTGLHGSDVDRLLALFDELVDDGATLVVVEHDLRVVAHADHVIDIGPGAGDDGGRVVFQGPPAELAAADTFTGEALAALSRR
ncbi:excinuclease ABC subunit UvrA [Actinomadura macrotermitis]|uniref:UvrABC system protein A n=1 Tax=Actinomadura macrotermitis TaxID=2585200 RepID=A0A7K0C0I8_9ACTN|nr:excinuclease ABC subunit UvrA [Actinomadura macrotermitis]MQY06957.1 UvrABC system protein A [Actinomadura macrotermitis]